MPAFAAERSGDADPNLVWGVTASISDTSPYSNLEYMAARYKAESEAHVEDIQKQTENGIPPAGILGTINVDGVNFRREAAEDADVLALLSRGQDVTVLERNGAWCKISYNGQVGFIKSARVSACGLPLDCTEGRIIGGIGEIRKTPDNNGELISYVYEGTTIDILSLENGWYFVSCGIDSGYVWADSVKANSDAAEFLLAAPTKPAQAAASEQEKWGEQVVAKAMEYLGTRYVYGGSTPVGFDCSGFTMYIYGLMGQTIPHSATSQWDSVGTFVNRDVLQPGDLVFFRDPSRSNGKACSHVGIYIGNGDFIHAASGSSSGRQVRISNLSEDYYNGYYIGAKRI